MSEEKHTPEETPRKTSKPVFIYIIILFMAAFLLMGLSFLTHQRNNTEALGQLQDSVNAMQQIQSSQEKIIALQEELAQTEGEKDQLQQQYQQELDTLKQEKTTQETQLDAFTNLYMLQQWYSAGNYNACQELIDSMEAQGLVNALPMEPYSDENGTVTAPALRFQQLKEAVSQKFAD